MKDSTPSPNFTALEAAKRSLELAEKQARDFPVERDFIQSHWLLGSAHRLNSNRPESEHHLAEALTRCRTINLVEFEADILIDLARLRADQDNLEEAQTLAQEALQITERSHYVLQGADINLFLAQQALTRDDQILALKHARKALDLATCDGPPYCYKVAYDEATALLAELEP